MVSKITDFTHLRKHDYLPNINAKSKIPVDLRIEKIGTDVGLNRNNNLKRQYVTGGPSLIGYLHYLIQP